VSVLQIVVPLALLVVGMAVLAFAWAVRKGQFDDLTTPAVRALFDDPEDAPRATEVAPQAGGPEGDDRAKR